MNTDQRLSDLENENEFHEETVLPGIDQSRNHVEDQRLSDLENENEFHEETVLPGIDQSRNHVDGFKFQESRLELCWRDMSFLPSTPNPGCSATPSSVSSEVESPDDQDLSDMVLKYISHMLMEEKPSMFHDPLALKATEKSLYEIIGEKYPSSPDLPSFDFDQVIVGPNDHFFGRFSEDSTSAGNSSDSQLVSNMFSGSESVLQFNRGVEEASKFLPCGNQFITNLEKYSLIPKSIQEAQEVVVKIDKDKKESPNHGSRGRKNHYREDSETEDERSSKQLAVDVEEVELSERFDRVLLLTNTPGDLAYCTVPDEELENGTSKALHKNVQPHKPIGRKNDAKKRANENGLVDLRTLLINCAQSVAANDCRTAYEQLKQIRQHSSPSGDGMQRLAHICANGLEARLAGTGFQSYVSQGSKRIIAAEKLEAYHLYLSACPFNKMAIFFAAKAIMDLPSVSTKRTLHVIDFGIQYGFQWPVLIQHLPTLPGGSPKLRITGIEFPQPGFRPSELIEKTGRHLAKYCERFNVPFEYNAIGQKWETIKIEDLKIDSNELLAVNCLFQFKNLLDDTVVMDSPRDAVLKLIREMNPDIFIHSVVNGSYNAPFFLTRFRGAISHYSTWFDMFDSTINCEDQEWLNYENEVYGSKLMNVVACEGSQRVERPESYKQWQIRNMRAGFTPLALNKTVVNNLRRKVQAEYHKEFVIDEDGPWMLQGWKGRILCASSCWVPR